MAGALKGIRVLDLTSVVMGPMATQILGDLGADVITVESARGETNRVMGPGPHPALSGTSLNLLRSKRNIALDLKHPDGHDVLMRLAAACDVPRIEIEHLETVPLDADVNFRGVGEGGMVVAPPTVVNAIEDALSPFGVRIYEQHLPPARILELIAAADS